MEDVDLWANKANQTDIAARVTKFRMEDLEYWANKGKKTESPREINIEDLEKWDKYRKCNKKNTDYSFKKDLPKKSTQTQDMAVQVSDIVTWESPQQRLLLEAATCA